MDNLKLQRISEIGAVLTRLSDRGVELCHQIKSTIENAEFAMKRNDQEDLQFLKQKEVTLLSKKKHIDASIIKYYSELVNELSSEIM